MKNKLKNILKYLGPGVISGAADDDPSGIVTFLQSGASFGYKTLWLSLFTVPFMYLIQEMSGRLGMVSGKGLAGLIVQTFSKKWSLAIFVLLFAANVINIGADMGAMADATRLLIPIPFYFIIVVYGFLILLLMIFIKYAYYVKYLKFLTFTLFSYVIVAFMVKQDWMQILQSTFIPHFDFSSKFIMNFIAICGTSISPYLFYWQASQEVEEQVKRKKIQDIGKGRPVVTKPELNSMRMQTLAGMIFSNIIMFFIIITAAATFMAAGIDNIKSATDAATSLKPLAGNFAFALFALAIISSGLLAVPVLAGSSSYSLTETFKLKSGLSKNFKHAKVFYIVIGAGVALGIMINIINIPAFKMLYYSAVFNGLVCPPVILMILLLANNKKILKGRTNGIFRNIAGIILFTVMLAGAVLLFIL